MWKALNTVNHQCSVSGGGDDEGDDGDDDGGDHDEGRWIEIKKYYRSVLKNEFLLLPPRQLSPWLSSP